jgi:ATP/maltotriose-dependent transcriptional regulator MalT
LTARADMEDARTLADRALRRLPEPDDERRIYPLRVIGMVALYVGRLEDGFREHAEMLRLARLHHHPYEVGMALLGLAQSRTYAGDPERGLAFAEEQHDVVQPLGNPSMLALAWYDQAEALATIDPTSAIEPYRRAVDLAESAGSTFVVGIALVGLASLLGRSAEPAVAFPLFRSIIGRWRRMGVWHHQWTTLRNLVQLLLRTEIWETAAVLLGAIDAGSKAAPAFGSDADLLRAAAERLADVLGAPAWSAARGRGAAMSRDEAVTFACIAIDEAVAAGLGATAR